MAIVVVFEMTLVLLWHGHGKRIHLGGITEAKLFQGSMDALTTVDGAMLCYVPV